MVRRDANQPRAKDLKQPTSFQPRSHETVTRELPSSSRSRKLVLCFIIISVSLLMLALPGVFGSRSEYRGLELLEGGEPALAVPYLRRALWFAESWHTWTFSVAPSCYRILFGGWTSVAPDTVYALGRALLQISGEADSDNTLTDAENYFKLAIVGNGNLWPAHANLATVQQRLGKPLSALESLQRAVDILDLRADGAPAPADPDQVLAALLFQQGNVLEMLPVDACKEGSCVQFALDAYRRALEHAPSHTRAKEYAERVALKLPK
eukprot:TRINITY_DN19838_c0_g1_i1.p1 TRINITY_DN19838_c0_g1~~TRINITY_DN19838_c0_g1_i1.p1  ORF type:complete len:284 (-),score=29.21 TRINITY_DN19838_c0_g1_i1:37-834(-)